MTDAITIDPKRVAKIRRLDASSHTGITAGACIMEAASYIAREPWSDHPECVCPVIGAFLRSWNDGLPDAERTALLLPLLPKLPGTRNKALEERRSLMAADWLVRTHTPAWLELAGLTAQAESLRALPEIVSMAQVPSIRGPIEAVKRDASAAWDAAGDAAWDAAWAAAGDAARAAAWDAAWAAAGDAARAAAGDAAWAAAGDAAWAAAGDAAGDAAWAAAGDAARAAARAAAGDAAWDAAWAAAWAAAGDAARAAAGDAAGDAARAAAGDAAWAAAGDAAWAAAGDAARAKLEPTRKALQASALTLVERMIELREAA
jgi:hypothetical protein